MGFDAEESGLRGLADVCERVASTTKRLEKTALLASYLGSLPLEEASVAALFLSGRTFPAWDETTLDIGGSILWNAVANVGGAPPEAMTAAYRRHGDLGAGTFDLFVAAGKEEGGGIGLVELSRALAAIAKTRGPAPKQRAFEELLGRASPLEAKYLVKIITSALRIGSKESLVEEAIARAYSEELAAVQRANMMLGDIGKTLELAREHRLHEAKLRLFHPIGFMLASPAKDANEAHETFAHALVEDKYDGIRAQAHVAGEGGGRKVRLFSRTRDEVTESFPELVAPLAAMAGDVILDGEILAYDEVATRARPFSDLQKRLGRKKPSVSLQRDIPVAFMAFDILYKDGEVTIDRSLDDRIALLDEVFRNRRPVQPVRQRGQLGLFASDDPVPAGAVVRAPMFRADSAAEIDALFDRARERNNEGLMIKDRTSTYAVGRRGKSWLKLKRELATLDVVVTGVELGHGKRAGVLSDYTFAVRDGDELKNIGKAYSGLTDVEIADMTKWFKEHTIEDRGHFRVVDPIIVLEIAFDRITESDRHESGYALRFPRIVRIRTDKPASDADTIETVRKIFASQSA